MINEEEIFAAKFGVINQAYKKRGNKEIFFYFLWFGVITCLKEEGRRVNHIQAFLVITTCSFGGEAKIKVMVTWKNRKTGG